jgi:hypothetical protein
LALGASPGGDGGPGPGDGAVERAGSAHRRRHDEPPVTLAQGTDRAPGRPGRGRAAGLKLWRSGDVARTDRAAFELPDRVLEKGADLAGTLLEQSAVVVAPGCA